MRGLALATLGLTILLASPIAPAVGAYVGVGPSEWSSYSSDCYQHTILAVVPSPLVLGQWAAEIDCAYAWPYNTGSTSLGTSGWPAHVASGLEGSPSEGLVDSGTANVHGTSPGTIDWRLTIGPLGESTAWSLDYVFYPDPDYLGSGPRPGYWRGVADFAGASS